MNIKDSSLVTQRPIMNTVYLRYGSHAEKEYFTKLATYFGGIIYPASFLESTPAATISLIAKLNNHQNGKPFVIDPMTYLYGEIPDANGFILTDLSWMQAKSKKGEKKYKKSSIQYSTRLGNIFSEALERNCAIGIEDLKVEAKRIACINSVIEFQENRIKELFSLEKDFLNAPELLPAPSEIMAPYFYLNPNRISEWLSVTEQLISDTLNVRPNASFTICTETHLLLDSSFTKWLTTLPEKGVKNIWFWFSDFNEAIYQVEYLESFIKVINHLSLNGVRVNNRHGGYFSLVLTKLGLSNLSHGVGYGESKRILPFDVEASPQINYHFPLTHNKQSNPLIERSLSILNIATPELFWERVCDCAICKGVLKNGLSEFRKFGEKALANEKSKTPSQTAAAMKISKFHFLLARAKEAKVVHETDLPAIIEGLKYSLTYISSEVFENKGKHIERWISVLSKFL